MAQALGMMDVSSVLRSTEVPTRPNSRGIMTKRQNQRTCFSTARPICGPLSAAGSQRNLRTSNVSTDHKQAQAMPKRACFVLPCVQSKLHAVRKLDDWHSPGVPGTVLTQRALTEGQHVVSSRPGMAGGSLDSLRGMPRFQSSFASSPCTSAATAPEDVKSKWSKKNFITMTASSDTSQAQPRCVPVDTSSSISRH